MEKSRELRFKIPEDVYIFAKEEGKKRGLHQNAFIKTLVFEEMERKHKKEVRVND